MGAQCQRCDVKFRDTYPHGGRWKRSHLDGSRTGLQLFTALQKLQCEHFHNPHRPLGLCQHHRLDVMHRLSDP